MECGSPSLRSRAGLLPLSLRASLLALLLAAKFRPASKLADNKAVATYRTPRPALAGGAPRSPALVIATLDRGRESAVKRCLSLRTGLADLPHPAYQSVVLPPRELTGRDMSCPQREQPLPREESIRPALMVGAAATPVLKDFSAWLAKVTNKI